MDLNYLFHRHQVELMRAGAAAVAEVRQAHRGFAREYARRIRMLQLEIGAAAPIEAR